MIKTFFKNTSIYVFGNILIKGINVFLIPIYTRFLSPKDYGIIDIFTIIASIVNIVFTVEITQAVARYIQESKDQNEKIILTSTAFWFSIFGFSLYLFLVFIFKEKLSLYILEKLDISLLFLANIAIVTSGIFYFTQNQLKWQIMPKESVIVIIINVILISSIAIFLLVFLHLEIKSIFIAQIIGNLISSCVAIYYSKYYKMVFSFEKLKVLLSFSYPLVFSGIGGFIFLYIDRIMIKEFLNLSELGIYGIAYRFASIVGILIIGFQQSLTPLIFKHYKDNNTVNQIIKIFNIFLVLALFIFIGSILFSKEIVYLLTTKEYFEAYKIIPILVLALFLSNMYIFAPGMGIAKKTKIIALLNIFVALLNVILNYFLIRRFGIIGASLATCLSALFMFVLYNLVGNRYYKIPYNWGKIILIVAFSTTFAIFVTNILHGLSLFNFFVKIIIIFAIELFIVLNFVDKEDIVNVWNMWNNK